MIRHLDADLRESGLRFETRGPVATITLDRPEARNAQSPQMWAAMARALDALAPGVRAVVIRGEGPVFSAGLDLALLDPRAADRRGSLVATARGTDAEILRSLESYQRPFAMLASSQFISVAMVTGGAVGAGFQLALACDLRIATTDAWFCMKEAAFGLVPDLTGTHRLAEAVGYARALEICATARRLDAAEAADLGVVQWLVGPHDADEFLATQLDALTSHSHDAVASIKSLLREASVRTFDDQRREERIAQVARFRALSGEW